MKVVIKFKEDVDQEHIENFLNNIDDLVQSDGSIDSVQIIDDVVMYSEVFPG